MSVRAKFKVHAIDKTTNPGGTQVFLSPVTSGSKENDSFYHYTPWGQLNMYIKNTIAEEFFQPGMEVYIDFSKVD
jgi:hypothetical protein